MLETFIGDRDQEEGRAAFVSTIPLGRLAVSADVASAALFLASDGSSFITGRSFQWTVGGGFRRREATPAGMLGL